MTEESGSATVEFTLVAPLALFVAVVVVQFVALLTANAAVDDAAFEAARAAARSPGQATRVATAVARGEIDARGVVVRAVDGESSGVAAIEVRVEAPVHLLGWETPLHVSGVGEAVVEPR